MSETTTATTEGGRSIVPVIVAAAAGAILAIGGALGLVSSQSATPAPVEDPVVVYGDS